MLVKLTSDSLICHKIQGSAISLVALAGSLSLDAASRQPANEESLSGQIKQEHRQCGPGHARHDDRHINAIA